MKPAERRAREMEAVREKILDAARGLFVERGYDAVSMRSIAGAIGYTAAALYTHFEDKDELMRALCRRDFGHFGAELAKIRRVQDPVERIARFGLAYLRFATRHPNQYRLMFMTPHPADLECDPADVARMEDPETSGYASFKEAVAEAIARGLFRPGFTDPELVSQIFWAGVHGVAALQITHGDDPCIAWRSLSRRASGMVDVLLAGMLTPAAAEEYRA
jgi:AcrR family transcriptional regulator